MYAEMYADKIKKARKPYISTKVTGIAGLQGVRLNIHSSYISMSDNQHDIKPSCILIISYKLSKVKYKLYYIIIIFLLYTSNVLIKNNAFILSLGF